MGKNNPEKPKKYQREKRANDETHRVAHNLRSRLRRALQKLPTHKTSKTEEQLGISFEDYKDYLEYLMIPELTWKNIDLDHVRPLSLFRLTDPEQLKEAAHFSNIQPLLKHDNGKKGSRYHEHNLAVQKEKVF